MSARHSHLERMVSARYPGAGQSFIEAKAADAAEMFVADLVAADRATNLGHGGNGVQTAGVRVEGGAGTGNATPLAAQVGVEEPDASAPIRSVCMCCDANKSRTRALWAQGFRVSHGICPECAARVYGVEA